MSLFRKFYKAVSGETRREREAEKERKRREDNIAARDEFFARLAVNNKDLWASLRSQYESMSARHNDDERSGGGSGRSHDDGHDYGGGGHRGGGGGSHHDFD